ncbi:hypothetical protein JCM11251_007086 [Rhodosporidiobolus azoricus]
MLLMFASVWPASCVVRRQDITNATSVGESWTSTPTTTTTKASSQYYVPGLGQDVETTTTSMTTSPEVFQTNPAVVQEPVEGLLPEVQPTGTVQVADISGPAAAPPSSMAGLSTSFSDGVPVVVLSSPASEGDASVAGVSATGTGVLLSGGVSIDPSRRTQTGFAAATPTSSSTSGTQSAHHTGWGMILGALAAVVAALFV